MTIIEKLLSFGVSVDINDNEFCTPLLIASRYGYVFCVLNFF